MIEKPYVKVIVNAYDLIKNYFIDRSLYEDDRDSLEDSSLFLILIKSPLGFPYETSRDCVKAKSSKNDPISISRVYFNNWTRLVGV